MREFRHVQPARTMPPEQTGMLASERWNGPAAGRCCLGPKRDSAQELDEQLAISSRNDSGTRIQLQPSWEAR